MTHVRHDEILDHADALSDIAAAEMAEAVAVGDHDRAGRWASLAQAVAEGIRAIRPDLHPRPGVTR